MTLLLTARQTLTQTRLAQTHLIQTLLGQTQTPLAQVPLTQRRKPPLTGPRAKPPCQPRLHAQLAMESITGVSIF